jgi:hypothetical protein
MLAVALERPALPDGILRRIAAEMVDERRRVDGPTLVTFESSSYAGVWRSHSRLSSCRERSGSSP